MLIIDLIYQFEGVVFSSLNFKYSTNENIISQH